MPSVLCWLYGPDEQDAARGVEACGIRIASIGNEDATQTLLHFGEAMMILFVPENRLKPSALDWSRFAVVGSRRSGEFI